MSPEEEIVIELVANGLTVVTAESLTGGMIAGTIVNAPGASACFHEGYIVYSEEAKRRILGVEEETLSVYGAVSAETVREMAFGALKKASADLAVAVSGFAGPEGGGEETPVGTVYVACIRKFENGRFSEKIEKFFFHGDRHEIRERTVSEALRLIRDAI